ncbi:MAG TPA: redoxin domain-containing protein [Acidimicrobiales bacterium]|jgi:peroxiredoxin Q/BCP|nr:redoxin domain-containing protein [Acidimicrobiales bacterium]
MSKGSAAKDFEAINQFGEPVRLFDLLDAGPVVLFFFPKALTPG